MCRALVANIHSLFTICSDEAEVDKTDVEGFADPPPEAASRSEALELVLKPVLESLVLALVSPSGEPLLRS